MNDPKALYKIYANWSGQLHHWVGTRLGRQIDCEFFPNEYVFKIYSGHARAIGTRFAIAEDQVIPLSTVPNLERPQGERTVTVQLPRPESDPSQEVLDEAFRQLCLAAARVLEIDLGKAKLTE
jgi:hypothetical protein